MKEQKTKCTNKPVRGGITVSSCAGEGDGLDAQMIPG